MVFFSLLELLLILLFLQIYHNAKADYHKELLHTMQLCSYSLACDKFSLDFVPTKQYEINRLYIEQNGTDSFFYLPQSEKYDMRLHYTSENYRIDMEKILNEILYEFIGISFLLFCIAIVFTLYSLKPIRKALKLNDEFIKDILHDFNTPISAMILNISMFNRAKGEDAYIKRVSQSINTMVLLQENLKTFLHQSPSQTSLVDVAKLVQERVALIASLYPKMNFIYKELSPFMVMSNKDLLTRIFDNLLTNASKYNKPNGSVIVMVSNYHITIQDTGKGIKDVKKVLQRYYREQERGLGLGLHIVQKLTQELNIELQITSEVKVGTAVSLRFQKSKESIYEE